MTAKLSALYLPGMNAEVSRAYMMKTFIVTLKIVDVRPAILTYRYSIWLK
jgi:hypothetical protein